VSPIVARCLYFGRVLSTVRMLIDDYIVYIETLLDLLKTKANDQIHRAMAPHVTYISLKRKVRNGRKNR
jgi:hypothetical protein